MAFQTSQRCGHKRVPFAPASHNVSDWLPHRCALVSILVVIIFGITCWLGGDMAIRHGMGWTGDRPSTPNQKGVSPMKDKPGASRRSFLRRWVSGAALFGLMTIPARAAINRFTKMASHYQSHPNGDARCGACRHFQPPGSCEVVMGHINPHGWCKWFRPGGAKGY